MNWEDIISLVKVYYRAERENDEETMAAIRHILPNYVKLD